MPRISAGSINALEVCCGVVFVCILKSVPLHLQRDEELSTHFHLNLKALSTRMS